MQYLLSSQIFSVQPRAMRMFSFSEPTLLFLYLSQPKSHSSSPPSDTALQYTVRFRLAFTLKR